MKFPRMIFARFSTVRNIALLIFLPLPVVAQVTITEIMYDLSEGSDSGREWIEVYAIRSVDLGTFKLREHGSSHSIKATAWGALPVWTYAVIADNPEKFSVDHPSYTGILFDSAFSLNNNGEPLSIIDAAGNTIDSVSYTDASGNGTGDSLQRNPGGNQFDAGIPTPGDGISSSGLVRSTPQQKGKKNEAAAVSAAIQAEVVGKSDFPPESPALMPSQIPVESTVALWWIAPILLGGFAAAGTSLSRNYKKTEWDIIEER